MEASKWEDTVINKITMEELAKNSIGTTYLNVLMNIKEAVERQAKATWHARDKEVEEARKLGRKDALDWIHEHSRMTYGRAYGEITFDNANWQAKVKEWGIT